MDSDQTTLNKTTGAISVLRAARTRVTSIQGRGEAGSVLLLHDAAATSDAAATVGFAASTASVGPGACKPTRSRD